MKKNLLSILILALLIVNIILTSVMMFTVMSTSGKTAKLVSDIASVIQLELKVPGEEEETQEAVPMKNTQTYELADMTIPLKGGADGKEHYALVNVTLVMNTKEKGYKNYGSEEELAAKSSLIKSEIITAMGSYSMEDLQGDSDSIRKDIVERLQKMFDSKFIYDVTFSNILYQ